MGTGFSQRAVVLAILLATIGAAIAVHLVSRDNLSDQRAERLADARGQVADAVGRRTFYLEDVADMVGVHDDADAQEFSRYAHTRARNEPAIVAVQWIRRSPTGELEPPAETSATPLLVAPADRGDAAHARAASQAAADDAIHRAGLDKEVGISAPLTLANGHPGFYLAVPVQARTFSGVLSKAESQSAIVGLVDAQVLVEQAMAGGPAAQVADGGSALGTLGGGLEAPQATVLPVPGRQWTLRVEGGSLSPLDRLLPWLISVLGLVLCGAVSIVLAGAARRRDAALHLAEERSAALAVSLDRVEQVNRDLELAHAEADHQARVDALTELHNRRHFGEVLERELARCREDGLTAGVLLLDLDHFKAVNDQHGHLAGDAVLRAVAGRLRAAMRSSDTLARWGGEEFAILAPGVDRDTMLELAERARVALTAPVVAGGATFSLRLSVGAALVGPGLDTADLVVAAADRALYEAKAAGRDCVRAHA